MDDTTRRNLISAAAIGAATAAIAAPAAAQPAPPARGGKQNPRDKYPKPPFPPQSQPWPGLAGRMDPRPDHGETSYVGSGRLQGRKALITGGDSGMGRAAAIAFAREGADVAINYLPAEEPDAREVVALIRRAGRTAVAAPGDLRSAAFCRSLVDQAVQGLGGLDIVVSNAGRQKSNQSILDVSDEDFDWTIKTNIYAPFWIIKAALPHLEPGSVIIGTTSEQAYDPSPDLYDYAQTKAATMNYVKSLAKQLASKGIRVNGVAPGPIWTPLQVSGGATQGKVVTFGATAPLGRPGQPAELAGIYVRLAEDDGSYTTGNIYGAGAARGSPDGVCARASANPEQTDTTMPRLPAPPAVAALALWLSAAPALSQSPQPLRTRDFLTAAAESDRFEIVEARVVMAQSREARIRAFAGRMIEDHARTSTALRQAAATSGVQPPPAGLGGDQQRMLGELQSLVGSDFDRAYARQQVLAHDQALVVEQGYARDGPDADIRRAAQSAVPLIAQHLDMARRLRTELGEP